MNYAERHLTDDEIDRLLRVEISGEIAPDDRVLFDESRQHIALCDSCKRLVSSHQELLKALRTAGPNPLQSEKGCVSESEIMELAAGVIEVARSQEVIDHCIGCASCGQALKLATASFRDSVDPDESAVLATLRSRETSWQEALAARLSVRTAEPTRRRQTSVFSRLISPNWLMWATAGVALIVILTAGIDLLRQNELGEVNALLVQAYSASRTLELRMPGARFAPFDTKRDSNSPLDEPWQLTEAVSRIKKRRGVDEKPDWLVARARAEVLERDGEAAVRDLLEVQALDPDRPGIQIDLGTAYFQRAKQTRFDPDFGKAVESLSKVLDNEPNNQVAIFNRALVYEALGLYHEAEGDWNRYLSVDPNGDWSNQARTYLDRVEQKQKDKKQKSVVQGLASPDAIGAARSAVSDDALDLRIELYQRIVLKSWAAEFLKSNRRSLLERRTTLGNAIRRISQLMVDRHRDSFLIELLPMTDALTGVQLESPIADLASAISANESGREQDALQHSRAAEREFSAAGNSAGVAYSEFEQAYALQFSSETASCQHTAESALVKSTKRHYEWIRTQSLIEVGFCSTMRGDLALATEKLREAMLAAERSGYEESIERAMVGAAAMEWQRGSPAKAWELTLEGLERYWSSSSSEVQGSSFLSILDLMAEETRQYYLQSAIIRESLNLLNSSKDQLAVAQTRYRLAGSELNLKQYARARADLELSLAVFRSAPSDASTLAQQLIVAVNLAKAELQSGGLQESLRQLQALEPQIGKLSDNLSLLDFYSTKAEAARKIGDFASAQAAGLKAIDLFQASLHGLSDPSDRLSWFREGALAYQSLVQLKVDQGDARAALERWEEYRDLISWHELHRTTSRGVTRSSPVSWKVIAYGALPDGIYGWVRINDEVQVRKLREPADRILDLVRIFTTECSSPSSALASLTEHGHQLYEEMISPFADYLTIGDNIAVELDDGFGELPFNALVGPTGDYFGSEYNLVLSAGSPETAAAFPLVSNLDPILLIVASNGTGRQQADDPLAAEEVQRISSLFVHRFVVSDDSSESSNFTELLSEARILHYAGHSGTTVQGGKLLVPGIAGSGDDRAALRAQDIVGHDLTKCHLVVLSACQTDVGIDGNWWNRENVALAFLNAGARVVVASRWQVDSSATSLLMQEFYSQLLGGHNPERALRIASSRVMRTKGFVHPYYWAAFAVLERV